MNNVLDNGAAHHPRVGILRVPTGAPQPPKRVHTAILLMAILQNGHSDTEIKGERGRRREINLAIK